LLQNWKEAYDRAVEYQAALGVAPAEREKMAEAAVERALTSPSWDQREGAVGATLKALRAVLGGETDADAEALADRFLSLRIDAAMSDKMPPPRVPDDQPPKYKGVFDSAPPL